MPFLNFGSSTNKYCNMSDMNFFMLTNVINVWIHFWPGSGSIFPNVDLRIRIQYYVKVDPRIRIYYSQMWIPGSGSTIPKCGFKDPDPRRNEMDPLVSMIFNQLDTDRITWFWVQSNYKDQTNKISSELIYSIYGTKNNSSIIMSLASFLFLVLPIYRINKFARYLNRLNLVIRLHSKSSYSIGIQLI